MDLTTLQQGVMFAVSAVASATFSFPSSVPAHGASLYKPEIIESYNLSTMETLDSNLEPGSIQNLNTLTSPVTDNIKLVIKESPTPESIITVEQPPAVSTVTQPTSKPTPSSSPKLTAEPESSPSPVVKEEKSAAQLSEVKAESSPSPSPVSTSSNADLLFQMTNDYRAKMGKPAFEKEERLCKIAEQRAPDVKPELASGTLHKGFKELNLPYWATENIAAYQTMEENFKFLSTDFIHRKAIESDAKYSCTACVGTSCSQIFSSFLSK
jgi:uncharacterized protein YkwD